MLYYTYILENGIGNLYIGQTNNLGKRLERHNQVMSTRNKGPWRMIFSKEHTSRSESMRYEKYLKSLRNPEYVRRMIITNNIGE